MPILETTYEWSLTSTGASTSILALPNECQNIVIAADCADVASTAGIGIEHARTSTGTYVRMGSTAYAISSGESVVIQLDGPLFYVRPYLISRTDSSVVVRISLKAN